MKDYLRTLALRAVAPGAVLRPRPAARFETTAPRESPISTLEAEAGEDDVFMDSAPLGERAVERPPPIAEPRGSSEGRAQVANIAEAGSGAEPTHDPAPNPAQPSEGAGSFADAPGVGEHAPVGSASDAVPTPRRDRPFATTSGAEVPHAAGQEPAREPSDESERAEVDGRDRAPQAVGGLREEPREVEQVTSRPAVPARGEPAVPIRRRSSRRDPRREELPRSVSVTIDRIEVVAAAPADTPAPEIERPALGLDDYLRARESGR